MDVEIRQASPGDADAAVDLIYSAAPDAYEFLYAIDGARARDYIRYEFQRGSGFLGAAAHTVAVADGQVAGIGSFYTGAGAKELGAEQAKNFIARFGAWQFVRMMPRGLRIQRRITKLEDGQLYIANLGVRAELRSKGIGKSLIEAAAQRADVLGLTQLVLDVSDQNPRAEALYRRLGFAVTKVRPPSKGLGGTALAGSKSMLKAV